jgi:hypothetical protein
MLCSRYAAAKHMPEAGQTERTDFHSRPNRKGILESEISGFPPLQAAGHNEVCRWRAAGRVEILYSSVGQLYRRLCWPPGKADYIMLSPGLYFHLPSPNLRESIHPPVHVSPKPALAYDADAPGHFGRPCARAMSLATSRFHLTGIRGSHYLGDQN